MIANPGAVYRSTNPNVARRIAADNASARSESIAAMDKFADSVVPGSTPYGVLYDDGSCVMSGVTAPSTDIDLPEGWRWNKKARGSNSVIVPALRTEAGKAAMAEMKKLGHKAKSHGAVSSILIITDGGDRRWFAQGVIEVIGDDVFATYHYPLDGERERGGMSDRDRVENDPNWEPVPLSEFYAARENHGVTP